MFECELNSSSTDGHRHCKLGCCGGSALSVLGGRGAIKPPFLNFMVATTFSHGSMKSSKNMGIFVWAKLITVSSSVYMEKFFLKLSHPQRDICMVSSQTINPLIS